MRAQQFLQVLQNDRKLGNQAILNLARAANLAQNNNIVGGWEGWLQVEIAVTFAFYTCIREDPYPSGQAAPNLWIGTNLGPQPPAYVAVQVPGIRCDFHLQRPGTGLHDDTYVELKCINPRAPNPTTDAWNRFRNDIAKIRDVHELNNTINGIALLASFGTFVAAPQFPPTMTAYIWDPDTNNAVTTSDNVALGGVQRFFIIAVSV